MGASHLVEPRRINHMNHTLTGVLSELTLSGNSTPPSLKKSTTRLLPTLVSRTITQSRLYWHFINLSPWRGDLKAVQDLTTSLWEIDAGSEATARLLNMTMVVTTPRSPPPDSLMEATSVVAAPSDVSTPSPAIANIMLITLQLIYLMASDVARRETVGATRRRIKLQVSWDSRRRLWRT